MPVDTSQPADRVRFAAAVEHGKASAEMARPVEHCQLKIPETVAALLDLGGHHHTFADAARIVLHRNGHRSH